MSMTPEQADNQEIMGLPDSNISINSLSVITREREILEKLQKPMGINELAEELGVSYYTVRNDILRLHKESKVRQISQRTPSGGSMYIAGSYRPMPILIPKSSNRPRTMQQIALVIKDDPSLNSLGSVGAAKVVMITMLELCHEAASTLTSGIKPSQEKLSTLKKQLVNARMLLGSQADLADQMIKIYSLWSNETLPNIADDEEFNHQLIEDAYSKYLSYLESVTPLITNEGDSDGREAEGPS